MVATNSSYTPAVATKVLSQMKDKAIPMEDALIVHSALRTGLCKAGELDKICRVISIIGAEELVF